MSYGRSRVFKAFQAFVQQVKSRGKEKVTFVGEDNIGNKYYEELRPNHQYRKVHRYFLKADIKDGTNVVDIANVPPLWDAWLRFRRQDPPTPKEMKDNEDYFKFQQELAAKRRSEKPPVQVSYEEFSQNLKKSDRQKSTEDVSQIKNNT